MSVNFSEHQKGVLRWSFESFISAYFLCFRLKKFYCGNMDYSQSDGVLFTEKPFATNVCVSTFNKWLCFSCFQHLKTKTTIQYCTQCQVFKYCSEECMKSDFSQHRIECPIAKIAARNWRDLKIFAENFYVRFVGRIYAKKLMEGGNTATNLGPGLISEFGNLRKFSGLKPYGKLPKDRNKFRDDWPFFQGVYLRYQPEIFRDFTKREFNELLNIAFTYAFPITKESFAEFPKTVGYGLYPQTSSIPHSCDPEATWYSVGQNLRLKLLRPVTGPVSFEDLTISHLENINTAVSLTAARRNALTKYRFLCECSKCVDTVNDDIKRCGQSQECPSCHNPLVVSFDQRHNLAQCNICKTESEISTEKLVSLVGSECDNCGIQPVLYEDSEHVFPKGICSDCVQGEEERWRRISKPGEETVGKFDIGIYQCFDRNGECILNTLNVEESRLLLAKMEKELHSCRNVLLLVYRLSAFEYFYNIRHKNKSHATEAYKLGKEIKKTFNFYKAEKSVEFPIFCAKMGILVRDQETDKQYEAWRWFKEAEEVWSYLRDKEAEVFLELRK